MIRLYIPHVPDFMPLVHAAQNMAECCVADPTSGYWVIESPSELTFDRKALGLKPALWYSMLCGGLDGAIADYGRDSVRIVGSNLVA